MKTDLTQKQLDQLAELITFDENEDGVLFIKDILGNVHGDVYGNIKGNVYNDIKGNVYCNIEGILTGKIAGKNWKIINED